MPLPRLTGELGWRTTWQLSFAHWYSGTGDPSRLSRAGSQSPRRLWGRGGMRRHVGSAPGAVGAIMPGRRYSAGKRCFASLGIRRCHKWCKVVQPSLGNAYILSSSASPKPMFSNRSAGFHTAVSNGMARHDLNILEHAKSENGRVQHVEKILHRAVGGCWEALLSVGSSRSSGWERFGWFGRF